MALPSPYPAAFLADQLRGASCRMRLQRHDEASTSGAGQVWTAELAPPIWVAELTLATRRASEARAIDAKLNALGTNRPLIFTDPAYLGPEWGDHWRLKAAAVTVASISTDRTGLALAGMPAGYRLAIGERLSIAYGAGRIWMGQLVESGSANGAGAIGSCAVYPPLPAGITNGAGVNLVAPECKMIVPPGGYTPFDVGLGFIAASTSLRLVQKV